MIEINVLKRFLIIKILDDRINKAQIEEKLDNSIRNLFQNQEDIFEFTGESGATEWNLAHHLAFEIQKEFPDYQHDIELTKRTSGFKRPDIVIHKRGNHNSNLLVVEVKYRRSIKEDIDKIRKYWFKKPLFYRFGASIKLNNPNSFDTFIIENHP